jgi:hypothetical protein
MNLTEYVCALFDHVDFTFLEGTFEIHLDGKVHELTSETAVQASRSSISGFPEVQTFFSKLEAEATAHRASIPNDHYILVQDRFHSQFLQDQEIPLDLSHKVRALTRQRYALTLAVPHSTDLDPMDYIRSVRDDVGVENVRTLYLNVVRAFQDYHIITQAPHIYVPDPHCRNAQGIFSRFEEVGGSFTTNTRAISDYWTPKPPDDAAEQAVTFFRQGTTVPIEDLLRAKALVYVERQNLSFGIIHAVMALEVVVPDLVNNVLKAHGVSSAAVEDFDNKFGLSVRVKAMLKLILPQEHHNTIDKAAEAIRYRNRIMHKGWHDARLPGSTGELVKACSELINIIRKYRTERFPTTECTPTN